MLIKFCLVLALLSSCENSVGENYLRRRTNAGGFSFRFGVRKVVEIREKVESKMLLKLLVLALVGYVASQGVSDPRCTTPDPVPAIRLPHDTDCTRHWICQAGLRHLMPACPFGNNFDSVTLTCRPPADATCGPVATTVPPVGTPEATTEEATTEEDTTSESTTVETTVDQTTGSTAAPPTNPTVPSKKSEKQNRKKN